MKALLVVLVLCGTAHAGGAPVDIDFHEAPFHDLMRLLGDVGRVNIVPLDLPADLKIDAKYKRVPWDKVLADLVKRQKLASVREGNVILIGDPAVIDARKKLKKRAFKGPNVDLDMNDADAAAAATLLATVSKKPLQITGGTKRIKQRLRRIPFDQAAELVAFLGGGTIVTAANVAAPPVAPPAKAAGCLAPAADITTMKLTAIGISGTTRNALLVDASGATYIAANKDCIGKSGDVVSDVGNWYVTFRGKTEELSVMLYPRTP